MLKPILKIVAASFLAAALASFPSQLPAQTTNKAAGEKKSAAAKKETAKGEKKPSAHPFHGKLAGVDKTAKTIAVGKSIYHVTSETKITKDGKPATLEEGVVGEPVSGYVKPNAEGNLVAATVHFGAKPEAKGAAKSK
jgi:hypothetical protein